MRQMFPVLHSLYLPLLTPDLLHFLLAGSHRCNPRETLQTVNCAVVIDNLDLPNRSMKYPSTETSEKAKIYSGTSSLIGSAPGLSSYVLLSTE